ncbi:MAG: ABC transporter substrate-binding protein [Anaerolineae bacterium]
MAIDSSLVGAPAASAVAGRGISRRRFLRTLGGGVLSVALTGCALNLPTQANRGGNKAQLVYQDWRTEWFPAMAREMLDRFQESNPNIRVFFTSDPVDLETRMLSDMEAGIAPDVFQGCCTHFPTWAQQGHCLDLRPFIWEDLDQATIDEWDPAQYRALSTRDGLQFGLPKYHGALALFYNRDIFDRFGLDYPDGEWTFDDYLAAMLRISAGRTGDGSDVWGSMFDISWDRIQVHVNSWGGHFVDPGDPTVCCMCGPQALSAMEWLRARLWDDRSMASPRDVGYLDTAGAFAAGQLAMVEDGSWSLRPILANAKFRVGVAPFPVGPVRRATLATSDGFGIYSRTKYPEAAWELMKFLIGKDYGRAMAEASFLQPARDSLLPEWMDLVRAEFPDATKDLDIAAFADGQMKGYSVTTEVFARMAGAREWANAAWQRIFTLGEAPVSTMESVCQRITEVQQGPQ